VAAVIPGFLAGIPGGRGLALQNQGKIMVFVRKTWENYRSKWDARPQNQSARPQNATSKLENIDFFAIPCFEAATSPTRNAAKRRYIPPSLLQS